jgi:N-acetyl sugar amidotransferase
MFFRCRRCLYPNTKPDIHFDADGICSACQAYDRRSVVDWDIRRDKFVRILERQRGKSHACVVAVSGGKDSHAQVLKVLELGFRPLAVCATTDHLTPLGRRNLDNIANLCDLVEVTPNKVTRAAISRFALQEIGDISWCEHQLIWSVPMREAIARKIPIVLYGECPQNEYGAGPIGSERQTRMTRSWIYEFGGLIGLRLQDVSDILGHSNLDIYRYPDTPKNMRAIFMGAYFPWDGYENFLLAEQHGFTPYERQVEGSLYNYENLDNAQTGIHDHLRWLKYGYSRALDIASSHIRRGRITRDEGIKLMEWREGAWPYRYINVTLEHVLERIGLTVENYENICKRFTNREVVQWASRPESFQCFSPTVTADVSKADNSMQAAE